MTEVPESSTPRATIPASPPDMRYVTPSTGWTRADVAELWAARELLLTFIARDVKVRYRQAVVGAAWVILQPLATLAIFQVFFGLLQRKPASVDAPYAVSAFIGLLTWQLVASSVRDATTSLVTNRQMLTRVYFPRLLMPGAAVGAALFDFAVAAPVLAGLMAWTQTAPAGTAWLVPAFLLLAVLFALAAAIWLSALNALYRDVGHVVPFALQIGFFLSPVIYESRVLIPARWQWLYELNPLATAITGVRWSLLGTAAPSGIGVAGSALLTLLLLACGLIYFRRAEQWIADRV